MTWMLRPFGRVTPDDPRYEDIALAAGARPRWFGVVGGVFQLGYRAGDTLPRGVAEKPRGCAVAMLYVEHPGGVIHTEVLT